MERDHTRDVSIGTVGEKNKNARLCIVEFFSWLTRLIQRPRSKGSLTKIILSFTRHSDVIFMVCGLQPNHGLSVLPLFPWNCGWKRESWYLAIASIKMYQLLTHGLIRSSHHPHYDLVISPYCRLKIQCLLSSFSTSTRGSHWLDPRVHWVWVCSPRPLCMRCWQLESTKYWLILGV